ncbi:MAG: hypothetical protein Q7R76_04930 [Candidatus Woesearchaeota archaeon]|nr:hypothetical protein [Candidatus Woesearchaeota archaeon]
MDTSIDFYLGFDPTFFHASSNRLKEAERDAVIEATAQQYRTLLISNRTGFENVLVGKETVGGARLELAYEELCKLMLCEIKDGGLLRKWVGDFQPLSVSLEELSATAGVTWGALDQCQQSYLKARVGAHLLRLMRPKDYVLKELHKDDLVNRAQNTVCETFAKEFIQWASQYHLSRNACYLAGQHGIGAEGDGPGLFWTVAPYVHAELKRRGMAPDKSMRKINSWALRAAAVWEGAGGSDGFSSGYLTPRMPSCNLDSYLGYDERMPTHLGARLQAVELVKTGFH